MTRLISCLVLLLMAIAADGCELAVFPNGEAGYTCFRIPAIIRQNNKLLAFAEGRKRGCSDFGDIDIVMKTSTDGGKSWSKLTIVVDYGELQAGNPAPVTDNLDPEYPGGRIFLFYNTGNVAELEVRMGKGVREVWYITSEDEGRTWSLPVNITLQVHRPHQPGYNSGYSFAEDWRGYANTPGHALQLMSGSHQGRIFVAANHTIGPPAEGWSDCFSHGYYTDDHGRSFHLSPDTRIPGSNEAMAAETGEGGILMNARNQKGIPRCRIVAVSAHAGESWDSVFYDTRLPDPVCQGSILNAKYRGRKVVIVANPASTENRVKLTLRMSFDDGRTWPRSLLLVPEDAAYSDMVMSGRGRIGVLFEKGNEGGIYFLSGRLSRLKPGKTR